MSSLFQRLPSNLDQQVAFIKSTIFVHQNGIISESIADKGIIYTKNYGVPIPELKRFAHALPHEAVLAQRLWDEPIRETMLLAVMLYPAEEMTFEIATDWISKIKNIELAELSARVLFSQTLDVNQLIVNGSKSSDSWINVIMILTAAYSLNRLQPDTMKTIDNKIWSLINNNQYEIYWSITVYLKKRGQQSIEMAKNILENIGSFQNSEKKHQRYIFEEVSTDLLFRYPL